MDMSLRYSKAPDSDNEDDTQDALRGLGTRSWDNPLHTDNKAPGTEKLYEAFNDLHTFAQRLNKPFDAPAILVVGHQTDGKSALVEALIGFQFTDVGGGTKTRRPIALHMKYNPACTTPRCVVVDDDLTEHSMDLTELQAFIQHENARLDEQQSFSNQELIIKIEYHQCPNLLIIDTPGLIAAPPGKAHMGLQAASRAVEAMLLSKAQAPELILLCLEDINDWSHATTRKVVMQADPGLSRTVLVSTKFDTRIATFSRPADVESFMHPACLSEHMLGGGPFFTSVPAGRVGEDQDAVFATNKVFRKAVEDREVQDVRAVEDKLGRRLDAGEKSHIGVAQLRSFLESLLKERYLQQVPTILPLLEREHRTSQARLEEAQAQLQVLKQTDLKDRGRQMTDAFLAALSNLMRGHASVPVEKFGETLVDEHNQAGCFTLPNGAPLTVPDSLPNSSMRLYGGAQFNRAMNEFRLAVGQMPCPEVSREEIANACGLEDAHDGANYMRAACVIAVAKARAVFEPFIHQLGTRLSHVMMRMLPAAMHMMQAQDRQQQLQGLQTAMPAQGQDALKRLLSSSFVDFINGVEASCKARCLEDLHASTRFVTWSLHTKGGRSLKSMLQKVKVPNTDTPTGSKTPNSKDQNSSGLPSALSDVLEQCLFNRQLSSTSEDLVAALVAQMFEGVRDYVVQAAELKHNCFFLMPVIDQFPIQLRTKLEGLYERDLDAVFHTQSVRDALQGSVESLTIELAQVQRLLQKFASIHSRLASQSNNGAYPGLQLRVPAQPAPVATASKVIGTPPAAPVLARVATPKALGSTTPHAAAGSDSATKVVPNGDGPAPHPIDTHQLESISVVGMSQMLALDQAPMQTTTRPTPAAAAAGGGNVGLPGADQLAPRLYPAQPLPSTAGATASPSMSGVKLFANTLRSKPTALFPRTNDGDASLIRDAAGKLGTQVSRGASPAPSGTLTAPSSATTTPGIRAT